MNREEKTMHWGADQTTQISKNDFDIAPDLWMFGGFGNVTVASTGEGLVIIDTSTRNHAKEIIKRLRARTDAPIVAVIVTHGHMDHAGGAGLFVADSAERKYRRPKVIGHELMVDRIDRYKKLNGFQLHMNVVQYGREIKLGNNIDYNSFSFLPPDYVYPDIVFRDAMHFKAGELTFQLYHSKGETDDNIWVYIPERKTVIAGDAVKGGMPNIGNPFKLMLRYELEWAEAMEKIAGLNPEFLVPGHGRVLNQEETQIICLGQAKFLRMVHDQVIDLMNRGYWLEDILEKVDIPEDMLAQRYMSQAYGCLDFVIRGIYNRYGGWYSGQAAEMFPSKRSDIAAAVVRLSGVEKILAEAGSVLDSGNPQLALHLIDFAVNGTDDKELRKKALLLKSKILDARAAIEVNGMAKNTFLRAALVAEQEANDIV